MTLRVEDFHVFALVMQEGSVGDAAAKLKIAQRSVMQRIRSLEQYLGTPLFNRSTGTMSPTPMAFRVLPYAQRCMSLITEVVNLSNEPREVLRVGIHHSSVPAARPLAEEALVCFPVQISVYHGPLPELMKDLVDRHFDIVIGPINTRRKGITIKPFVSDQLVCATPPDNELLVKNPVRLMDLDLGQLSIRMSSLHDSPYAQIILGRKAHPSNHPVSRIRAAVQRPVRISGRATIAEAIKRGELAELNVEDLPSWTEEIRVAYHPEDANHGAVRALLDAATAGTLGD